MACIPAIFFVNKQIRDESLAIYYQNRKFCCSFPVGDSIDVLRPIHRWLDRIGELGRSNSRRLELRIHPQTIHEIKMNDVHSQLSEDATVIWEVNDDVLGKRTSLYKFQIRSKNLWRIQKQYAEASNYGMPICETGSNWSSDI